MNYAMFILLLFGVLSARGQILNNRINKDSLLEVKTNGLPKDLKEKLKQKYQSASKQDKEFLLFILCEPRSSKKEMVNNIDSNYYKIEFLRSEYIKLAPKNCIVSIEFNPGNPDFNIKESIDMRISKTENNETTVSQDWSMEYGSEKLKMMLQLVGWGEETMDKIKKMLIEADCISIENGEITTVGFGRSGLGLYSFLIFNADLTKKQINLYNDGCRYIYLKKNIVLQYEGGATGSQCFPDWGE